MLTKKNYGKLQLFLIDFSHTLACQASISVLPLFGRGDVLELGHVEASA